MATLSFLLLYQWMLALKMLCHKTSISMWCGQFLTLYVHMMKAPEKRVLTVHSLHNRERVKHARLLGSGEVAFEQHADRVCVRLPDRLPTRYVNCVALELV